MPALSDDLAQTPRDSFGTISSDEKEAAVMLCTDAAGKEGIGGGGGGGEKMVAQAMPGRSDKARALVQNLCGMSNRSVMTKK